jgi:hypothetical protein
MADKRNNGSLIKQLSAAHFFLQKIAARNQPVCISMEVNGCVSRECADFARCTSATS